MMSDRWKAATITSVNLPSDAHSCWICLCLLSRSAVTSWETWRWCSWTLRWRTSPACRSPGGSTGTSTTRARTRLRTRRRWWRSWRWCSGTSRPSSLWPWWVQPPGTIFIHHFFILLLFFSPITSVDGTETLKCFLHVAAMINELYDNTMRPSRVWSHKSGDKISRTRGNCRGCSGWSIASEDELHWQPNEGFSHLLDLLITDYDVETNFFLVY